ncbi:MAG: TIGR04552 family protein, partial [Bdellovibrionota bacterium]
VSLLLMASSKYPRKRYKRLWACSLLKVMYSIANIQFSGKLQILDYAREQIFKKIKNLLVAEQTIQFKNFSLNLNKVEWKEAKTRTSIVLKLLHKPDSIVDEVFDYLGVRFVVQSSNEIPILLKLLIDADIIIPHQVVSVRTRNSILNMKNPKRVLTFLMDLYSCGTLSEEQFYSMSSQVSWQTQPGDDPQKRVNLFTSQHYRSLQFTVRHLVRTSNPAFLALESLSNQLKRYTGVQRQEPWMESVIPEQFANYFPIEIQILDLESYELAKFGPASHEQYKSSQLKAVRDRVLGSLVRFNHEKTISQEM